jgi:hypothetical protein
MTALEQLNLIKDERYVTEDGEEFGITLKAGLSDQQIDQLAARLPGSRIPPDIRQLLKHTSGFFFPGLDDICFDGVDRFGFENVFPVSVELAGDGAGNFWIIDINNKGEWGPVFFVCHDPAVVVKQSENLAEFLEQVDELGKKPEQATLSVFLERTTTRIFMQEDGFMDIAAARSSEDRVLREFATGLPDTFIIADLRHEPIQTGFFWGKYGPEIDNALRHDEELLWGFEVKAAKKPWWKFW